MTDSVLFQVFFEASRKALIKKGFSFKSEKVISDFYRKVCRISDLPINVLLFNWLYYQLIPVSSVRSSRDTGSFLVFSKKKQVLKSIHSFISQAFEVSKKKKIPISSSMVSLFFSSFK